MRRAATRPRSSPSSSPRRAGRRCPITPGSSRRSAPRNQAAFVRSEEMVMVGDGRLRHGHRQARRALRRPCRHPQVDRGLLPGDRPRRARRRAGRGLAVLGRRGFRPRPPADRDRGRARPPAGRARAAERARRAGRERRPAAARSCCAISARTRPTRCGNCDNCLDPPADDRRHRGRAQIAVGRVPHRDALRRRHLADVLAGNDNEKVRGFGHHGCRCSASPTPRKSR